jgi:CheY-like chemotaxis protein
MNINKKILIIDDDPDYCNLVSELLSPEFNCESAYSGQQGIDAFMNRSQPILVIVDLNLPDMTGFEVCEKLNKYKTDCEFALFVISGDEETASRLKAFEHGADDYISKPFQLKELYSRINRSIYYVHSKEKLKQEGSDTREIANIAMAQASQYSYVMNFFKALNHCQSIEEIAQVFFDAMSFFKLSASIKMVAAKDHYFDYNMGDVSPIEKSIYDLLKNSGRLYEFGSRILVNGSNVSFLVKNFPKDEHQAGQARDFLAALIEGVESKLKDLSVKTGLIEATLGLNQTISNINEGLFEHSSLMASVITNMTVEISASYHALELTDQQELFFTNLVEKSGQSMSGAEDLIKNIQQDLENLLLKMESIQLSSSEANNSPDDSNENVDLF